MRRRPGVVLAGALCGLLPGCPATKDSEVQIDSVPSANAETASDTGCDPAVWCYPDADGDGFGALSGAEQRCACAEGTTPSGEDCDDDKVDVYPGAVEVCEDGVVNDCAGNTNTAYADCTGETSLETSFARWDGEQDGDRAGYAVSDAGDVDGDGLADVLIGAVWHDGAGALWTGAAYIVRGAATGALSLTDADAKISGDAEKDILGFEVTGAGDVDGDGLSEVLIGVPGRDDAGDASGAAVLFMGPVVGEWSASDADATLLGEVTLAGAGFIVSDAGDLNGDGLDDLLVGATRTSDGSLAGGVYGLLGPVSGTTSLADANLKLYGAIDYGVTTASDAGDVDGDGLADTLVGCIHEPTEGAEAGAAYLVRGPLAAALSLADADATFFGETALDRAGSAVSAAGDTDGDGLGDLLIGAYAESSGGNYAGAVYLLRGPRIGIASLAEADAKLVGNLEHGFAGAAVSDAGDVDGDGLGDVLIGAYWADVGRHHTAGVSYVVSGPATGVVSLGDAAAKLQGIETDDWSGYAVSGAGDWNGDGHGDIVIGAFYTGDADAQRGSAYLVLGGGW